VTRELSKGPAAIFFHRREGLRPEDVGLPGGGRRRTPGLRREEVAGLAMPLEDYLDEVMSLLEADPSRLSRSRLATTSMIRNMLPMNAYEELSAAARTFGAIAVVIGLLIAGIGFVGDEVPVRGYYFAGLLVFVGCAVRIEAAVKHRHAPVEIGQGS
jgi:hypothetical protein